MIIDKSIIENGITPAILGELINKHELENERYRKLQDYYAGKHSVLERRKKSSGANNTKVVCNHAKYITDMSQAYLAGNPVTYSAAEEFDIEPLKEAYSEQDMPAIDSSIVKGMSICGRCYELVYMDEAAKIRSVVLPVGTTFNVYDNTAQQAILFSVQYYKRFDLNGNCIGVVCCVHDSEVKYTYEGRTDNWHNMELTSTEQHYFGRPPVIEYRNNDERQGDFEQLIPLIDAYNILQSDRVNDKEQFVDAFLFLTGIDIDSEQAAKLREERILMGYDGAKAEYLSKIMSEADIEVLRNSLREDIHRFAMVPNLTDENFGNNLSGVAIKYKLLGFEQNIRNKERHLTRGLKERLQLYITVLSIKSSMHEVPLHKIKIDFTRNLPVNELEISQMINNLRGIVSDETLTGRLSFIDNPADEQNKVTEENAKKYNARVKAVEGIASGGGYGRNFNNY